MKNLYTWTVLAMLVWSCGLEQTPTDGADNTADTASSKTALPAQRPDCDIEGEALEGNVKWIENEQLLVCIVADSSTRDKTLGPSHRIFEVYDAQSCSLEFRQVLPVDRSPDFSYRIADILYNNVGKIIAIKSFSTVLCFDIKTRELFTGLEPQFMTERPLIDAQSGMIRRLEVWENYLIGYAQDMGAFVFDLNVEGPPKPVLPVAEYRIRDGLYTPLFILKSTIGQSEEQAILPTYDFENNIFKIHPVFQSLTRVHTNIPAGTRNNRFIVLHTEGTQKALVVDMKDRKEIALPESVARQPVQQILEWVRSQNR